MKKPIIKPPELVAPETGITLPESHYIRVRTEYAEDVARALNQVKIKAGLAEKGHLWVKHTKQAYRLHFDMEICQKWPVDVTTSLIAQWAKGKFQPPQVMKILTIGDQIKLIKVEGKTPKKPGIDAGVKLDKAIALRQDLRRQGFDPKKEGLD